MTAPDNRFFGHGGNIPYGVLYRAQWSWLSKNPGKDERDWVGFFRKSVKLSREQELWLIHMGSGKFGCAYCKHHEKEHCSECPVKSVCAWIDDYTPRVMDKFREMRTSKAAIRPSEEFKREWKELCTKIKEAWNVASV